MLQIIVVGAGIAGQKHIGLVANSPDCDLVAIVDPSPAAAELARAANVPHFTQLERCLDAVHPDGVIIATPNLLHLSHAVCCLNRGFPLLLEKPIADSLDAAAKIVEAAERTGTPLLVGHHRRHNPILQRAKQMIADGALGEIVAANGNMLFFKPDEYFEEGQWRKAPGGGPILINLIHAIDDLRFMCGEITAVQAFSSSEMRGFAVEDTAVINFRFSNGALGNFTMSDTVASARSWEHTAGENTAYPHYTDEDCYYIAGNMGSLAIPTMRLTRYAGKQSWLEPIIYETISVEREDGLVRQLQHFSAVVAGTQQPLVTGRDAMRTLEVTIAAAEAAKNGSVWSNSAANRLQDRWTAKA